MAANTGSLRGRSDSERTAAWKILYGNGAAGAACDRIVRARPVPVALLAAVARADPRHRDAATLPAYVRESLRGRGASRG